jgi:hypothetical protein
LFIALMLVNITYGIAGNNQQPGSGFAKIKFVDNNADHSKTYLGKLVKGDLQSLKYELQNSFAEPVVTVGDKSKSESEGYVNRVTSKKIRYNAKKRVRKAKNDLFGNYTVDDEKSLAKIKEKKEKEEKEAIANISSKYNGNDHEQNLYKSKSNLSRHFRVAGRRMYNGQSFRKRAGYVSMIIKYKIREGNQISTYVTIVEDYLKEGSKYNLKYHGNGSKRKYYFEFVSAPVN